MTGDQYEGQMLNVYFFNAYPFKAYPIYFIKIHRFCVRIHV